MDADYLLRALAPPLISAVTETCLRRPADPIAFIAHHLKQHHSQPEHMGSKTPNATSHPVVSMADSETGTAQQPANRDDHVDFLELDLPAVARMDDDIHKLALVHQDCIEIDEDLFDDEDLI